MRSPPLSWPKAGHPYDVNHARSVDAESDDAEANLQVSSRTAGVEKASFAGSCTPLRTAAPTMAMTTAATHATRNAFIRVVPLPETGA